MSDDDFEPFSIEFELMHGLRWAYYRRVLVALLRLHSDDYAIEWLCEHQRLPLQERAAREAIVLLDYGLIA